MNELRPQTGRVSVFVCPQPNADGLAMWQYGILTVCGLLFLWSMAEHAWLPAFLAYSFGLGAIRFPTAHRPLEYVRYLRKAISSKPGPIELQNLACGASTFTLFGRPKIVVACSQLPLLPTLMDPGVEAIAGFLRLWGETVEFVITTSPQSHKNSALQLAQCLLMIDAEADAELRAERLLNCARRAGLKTKTVDPGLFEIAASHNYESAQYIVERLPYTMWLGDLSRLVQETRCYYTTIVKVCPADLEATRQKARKLFGPMAASLPRLTDLGVQTDRGLILAAARDLLSGKTQPYDVSIDISLCAPEGVLLSLSRAALSSGARRMGMSLKHVRSRRLPYLSTFREPPAPYSQTVSEAAAVACCPFFLGGDARAELASVEAARSQFAHFLSRRWLRDRE